MWASQKSYWRLFASVLKPKDCVKSKKKKKVTKNVSKYIFSLLPFYPLQLMKSGSVF